LCVEEYPESYNAYDSLGEAYMNNGEKDPAIKNYQKSLQLNPKNVNAVEMLKKLNAP
jgi:cytochrome c-type biogenesis protein CcmH/NrfG